MIWSNFFTVCSATLKGKVPFRVKARLLGYLTRRLILAPFGELLWYMDNSILDLAKQHTVTKHPDPVFIISSPRSGSTFLHRTLAEDENTFFAVTYLEWHYPYLFVWWLIDLLGFRERMNRRNYWPNNAAGRVASKMHPHKFGDYEEHGVFLEEHCFAHFFCYRRFPFPEVLDLARIEYSSSRVYNKILRRLMTVVEKVAFYRAGEGQRWLTKENESLEVYKALMTKYEKPLVVFLDRDLPSALASYGQLSIYSTWSKTGIDPRTLPWWEEKNQGFRVLERYKFETARATWQDTVKVSYSEFVKNPRLTVEIIYQRLGLRMSLQYRMELARINREQSGREKGYA